MAVKVVDTSALAALLFGEPAAAEMAGRLGAHTLAAPTLLRYELGSVARKKRERYPALADDVRLALETFEALSVEEVEVPVAAMVDLAEASGVTVYDAAFLWLSRHLRAELVTLDRQLAGAAARR
jgi:predicted nucleic acid-binding protein